MLTFNLESPASGTINVTEQKVNNYKMYTLNYPCPSSTSCTPYTTTLPTGKYKFEVIGAGGGTSDSSLNKGGMGGLSIGYFEVASPILAYFNIGGKGSNGAEYSGKTVNIPGGYNGGGNGGYWGAGSGGRAGGGGGSSDIRISSNDISKRIIVAGGGGGGCIDTNSAGNGGGKSGTAGNPGNPSYSKEGGPGTEASGGYTQGSGGATAGRPLYGGNGGTYPKSNGCGGGGGGYFGGGGGCSTSAYPTGYCASGGGGSGYVGGVKSSSRYSITASTTTHTNTGNGFIKITVFEAKYSIFTIDLYVYSIPLLYLHVFVLLDHPLSKL